MKNKKKKKEKIVRIATILGQLRGREVSVPSLLTRKGMCNTARWSSVHIHVLHPADAGLSFPPLPWKLSFVFHWKMEDILCGEKPPQNTRKHTKLNKQKKKSSTEIL